MYLVWPHCGNNPIKLYTLATCDLTIRLLDREFRQASATYAKICCFLMMNLIATRIFNTSCQDVHNFSLTKQFS